MYGFNNGLSTLNDLCGLADIIAVQEHWLAPYDLAKLTSFSNDFVGFGWSAMHEKLQTCILTGRPFGCIGVLIKKNLGLSVTVLQVMHNCRSVCLKCVFPSGRVMILVVVYFPCTSASADYECEIAECLGFIEECLLSNTYQDIVILGDMNFDCVDNSLGYKMFSSMCKEIGVQRADSVCGSAIDHTYCQESSNRYSVIDHIFVSDSLAQLSKSYFVFDQLVNFSDHTPVGCNIDITCTISNMYISGKQRNFK